MNWLLSKLSRPALKSGLNYLQHSQPDSAFTANAAQLATSDNPFEPTEHQPFQPVNASLMEQAVEGSNARRRGSRDGLSLRKRAVGAVRNRVEKYAISKGISIIWAQLLLPLTIILWVVRLIAAWIEDSRISAALKFKSKEAHDAQVAKLVTAATKKAPEAFLALKRPVDLGHMIRSADKKKEMGPAAALQLPSYVPEDSSRSSSSDAPAPSAGPHPLHLLDISRFNSILSLDTDSSTCTVEAGCTFRDLLRATLHSHLMPPVVPPLLDITVGGAVAGGAFGSTSWRNGSVMDSVVEMELLLASGEVIWITREGPHADLFHMMHGSFHSLATILALKIRLVHAPRYVHLHYECFKDVKKFNDELQNQMLSHNANVNVDHVDAIMFSPKNFTMITTTGIDTINTSQHKVLSFSHWWEESFVNIVATWSRKHLAGQTDMPKKHVVRLMDYLARYESLGGFWLSEFVFNTLPFPLKGNNFISRLCLGWTVHSPSFVKRTIANSSANKSYEQLLFRQDALIPLDHFHQFFNSTLLAQPLLGISSNKNPLWLCPILANDQQKLAPNFQRDDGTRGSGGFHFLQVGTYLLLDREDIENDAADASTITSSFQLLSEYLARVHEAGGRTMLYGQNVHSPEWFSKMYTQQRREYDALRKKYGAQEHYPHVLDKIALSEEEKKDLSEPLTKSADKVRTELAHEILMNRFKPWG